MIARARLGVDSGRVSRDVGRCAGRRGGLQFEVWRMVLVV